MKSMPYGMTLHLLAARWRDAATLLPAFRLLAQGRPLAVEEIARASGVTDERVSHAIAAARCGRDADGRIVDLYGLRLAPTLHRLEIGHKVLFSCCALWAHVIPKLVDATVRVESVDPVCREIVRLSLSPERVQSADPAESAGTLALATREAIDADVGEAFCSHARHFVSHDSAQQFAAARPSRHPVTLAELHQAADELYNAIVNARGFCDED